jgi:hypothetical protein
MASVLGWPGNFWQPAVALFAYDRAKKKAHQQ